MTRYYDTDADFPEVVNSRSAQYDQEGLQVDKTISGPIPFKPASYGVHEKVVARSSLDEKHSPEALPTNKPSLNILSTPQNPLSKSLHRWKRALLCLLIGVLILAIVVPLAILIPRSRTPTSPSGPPNSPSTLPQSLSNVMLNSRLATTWVGRGGSSNLLFYQMANGSLALIEIKQSGDVEDVHLLPNANARNNTPLTATWQWGEDKATWHLFYTDVDDTLQSIYSLSSYDDWWRGTVGMQLNLKVRGDPADMFSAFPGIFKNNTKEPRGGAGILVCDDDGLRQVTFTASTETWSKGDLLSESCTGGSVGAMFQEAFWSRFNGQELELWYGDYSDPEEMQWVNTNHQAPFNPGYMGSTCSFDNLFAYVNTGGGIRGSNITLSVDSGGTPQWSSGFDVKVKDPLPLVSNTSLACFRFLWQKSIDRYYIFYQLQNGTVQAAIAQAPRMNRVMAPNDWIIQNIPT